MSITAVSVLPLTIVVMELEFTGACLSVWHSLVILHAHSCLIIWWWWWWLLLLVKYSNY